VRLEDEAALGAHRVPPPSGRTPPPSASCSRGRRSCSSRPTAAFPPLLPSFLPSFLPPPRLPRNRCCEARRGAARRFGGGADNMPLFCS
jgi:hypothetical protein